MKYIIRQLFVVLIMLFGATIHAFSQDQDPESMAREYLSLVEQNRFDAAASLFHYPKSYTDQQKKSEFYSVKKGLKGLKDNLGNITQILNYIPDGKYVGYGVSGADINYWHKNQKQSQQIIIPCRFKNIDWCAIRITFCNIENRLEIQSIDYSLIKTEESKKLLKKLEGI